MRGSVSPCARGGSTAAVSGRFGFVPDHVIVRPFFSIGAGFVHAKSTAEDYYVTPNGGIILVGTVTKPAVAFSLGMDLRLTHALDLRVIELAGAAGGSSTSSEAVTASYSSGLVYHFGHQSRH